MIREVVTQISNKYRRQCNEAVSTLLSMASISVKRKTIENIKKQIENSDYKFINFQQPYNNGQSEVYILANKNGITKGYTIELRIDPMDAKVLKTFHASKEDLDKMYSKTFMDILFYKEGLIEELIL